MSGRITAALTGLTFGLLTAACSQDVHLPEPATVFQVTVVNTHPHDTGAYTQGLEFVDEMLLESTGRIGRSSIRLVEPETG
ncbi:MAG: glutaminyl-peptide cyclotransferase, partial [Actinomycetota bacterium]